MLTVEKPPSLLNRLYSKYFFSNIPNWNSYVLAAGTVRLMAIAASLMWCLYWRGRANKGLFTGDNSVINTRFSLSL